MRANSWDEFSMRWDLVLFFASLVMTGLGETWSLYVGVAGMTVAVAHGLARTIKSGKLRKTAMITGLIISGVVFITLCGFLMRPAWFGLKESPKGEAHHGPDIVFPKYALFWVQSAPGTYDLGLLIKLFNSDARAYTINGISFDSAEFQIVGRGSWYIKRLTIWPNHGQVLEDRYIKAGTEGYYKILLPLQTQLTPANGSPDNSGPPPGLIIKARWRVVLGEQSVELAPDVSATYEKLISRDEWDDLNRPHSKINVENLRYQPISSPSP